MSMDELKQEVLTRDKILVALDELRHDLTKSEANIFRMLVNENRFEMLNINWQKLHRAIRPMHKERKE